MRSRIRKMLQTWLQYNPRVLNPLTLADLEKQARAQVPSFVTRIKKDDADVAATAAASAAADAAAATATATTTATTTATASAGPADAAAVATAMEESATAAATTTAATTGLTREQMVAHLSTAKAFADKMAAEKKEARIALKKSQIKRKFNNFAQLSAT